MKKTVLLILVLTLIFVLPACTKATGGATDKSNSHSQSAENELISRDKAIETALKDAGLAKTDVYDLEAELDYEFYGTFWEVSFDTREHEYSYDLNAKTGDILHKAKERND